MSNSDDGDWQKLENDLDDEDLVACSNSVYKVKLDKDSSCLRDRYGSKYFVLPAGGMQVAYPDMEFHVNHFNNENDSPAVEPVNKSESSNSKINSTTDDAESLVSESDRDSVSKLPFGLELTAGPGSVKHNKENSQKRALQPSETLLASAAFLKSFLLPNFENGGSKDENASVDTEDSVRDKFVGIWHNLKYGWSSNLKTNFSKETPIYMLGMVYHKTFKETQTHEGFSCSNIEGFKADFANLGWFTYRRKFAPLPESSLTTDCGWGCMLRSGQMMIMTALSRHFLPDRHTTSDSERGLRWDLRQNLVKLFCDTPLLSCPFSIHNLVRFGLKLGKRAGDWYGPSCVAHMFKDAFEEGSKHVPELDRLGVYVAQDGAVYIQDVLDAFSVNRCVCRKSNNETNSSSDSTKGSYANYCTSAVEATEALHESFLESNGSGVADPAPIDLDHFVNRVTATCDANHTKLYGNEPPPDASRTLSFDEGIAVCCSCQGWKSCIILIPVRLGGASLNPIYNNCLYSLFLHDLCIGIIGGRPKHSLYFIGFQDTSLIHMDPHFCQDVVLPDEPTFTMSSFLNNSPRKIRISKIDPSATIGFYCHTKSQFLRLIQEASIIANANDGKLDSPIFEFVDGRNETMNGWFEEECRSGNANDWEDGLGGLIEDRGSNPAPSRSISSNVSLSEDIEQLSLDS